MAHDAWYYAKDQQHYGPVTFAALRDMVSRGLLEPSELVWTEGMVDWTAAGQVHGLFPPGPAAAGPMPAPIAVGYYTPVYHDVRFAGFWLRFCAAFLDGLILLVPNIMINLATGGFEQRRSPSPEQAILGCFGSLLMISIAWLYSALMESSVNQGTVGKMAVGIKVTDVSGQRISFGRATGRHFAKMISGIILLIGYLMAAFTERKQALHDMIASTLVVRKQAPQMQELEAEIDGIAGPGRT